MTIEEKAKAYDNVVNKLRRFMEHGIDPLITRTDVQDFFPELADSEDERMKKAIIHILYENYTDAAVIEGVEIAEIVAWLEKQGKPKWSDEDEKRLQSCIIELQGKGLMGGVDTIDTKWLKSLKQRIHDNFEKTCKNDTILNLLQKMPSYITVDGIFYHFRLRKTTISYMAFYEGEGEGSGKVIFWMTAFSPIDLLNEMLEHLKKKGLL